MKTRLVVNRSEVSQIAAQYCIPEHRIAQVREKTCDGGYSTYEVLTAKGKGWQGCGHPRCTLCQYKCAEGIVGDDAIEAYMDDWLDMFFTGEVIPPYAFQCLTSETWRQRYW